MFTGHTAQVRRACCFVWLEKNTSVGTPLHRAWSLHHSPSTSSSSRSLEPLNGVGPVLHPFRGFAEECP